MTEIAPLGATHYRPLTQEFLKRESGVWYIEVNGYWQVIKNPFGYEMVGLE